jgi:hypothetical protein
VLADVLEPRVLQLDTDTRILISDLLKARYGE